MPFFPLWSSVITKKRLSNALIERWFGFLKNNLLNGNRNTKPTTFIRKVRRHVKKVSNEVKYGISKYRLASTPKNFDLRVPKLQNKSGDDEPCENWNRKKKPKFSFFSGKYLKLLQRTQQLKDGNQRIELLKNYCVNNPTYYKDFPDLIYYVGYYPFVKGERLLTSTEFNTLSLDMKSSISSKIFNIFIKILVSKMPSSKKWLEVWSVKKSFTELERKMLLGKVPNMKKKHFNTIIK